MANKPTRKSYAKRTRRKRSQPSWKLPSLRQIVYGLTFLGGFSGLSWTTACNKAADKPKTEQIADNTNKPNRDENNRNDRTREKATGDEDFPELPAVDAKDRKQVVKHKFYTLLYNEKHEQPAWVAYKLEKRAVMGKAERANNFREDPDVPTGSATPDDYRNSGYDRGHLAPAADFKQSKESMSETFFMSNMSPQTHDFNAGIWETLESKVREWAKKRGTVYVVAGPVLQDGLPTIGKKNKVSIPKEYFKVVYDPAKKEMIGFLMPHRRSAKQLAALAMKVDDIEKRTGLDFFPTLPDDLEEKLESQVKAKDWFGSKGGDE